MNYICLLAAIVIEVVATTALARSGSFTKLYPSLIAAVAWLRYGQKLDAPGILGLGFIILGCVIADGFSKSIPH